MGAGVLPIAKHNGKLYFLFSREYGKGKEEWRDFGGTRENNETDEETAAREGWEESAGFLGSQKKIKKLIKKKILKVTNIYSTFVILIDYDKALPKKFNENFKKMYKKDKTKICKNGFYEKDKLKWISLNNLPQYYHIFPTWYRKIVRKIYKEIKRAADLY